MAKALFPLVKFVRKTVSSIVPQKCLPYLPWPPWLTWHNHRYLGNIDISSFVRCLILVAPHLPMHFLLQALTVLMRQTRQAVLANDQSIFLRCLWTQYRLNPIWSHHLMKPRWVGVAISKHIFHIFANPLCQCIRAFNESLLWLFRLWFLNYKFAKSRQRSKA
jgi:hypothetical protein